MRVIRASYRALFCAAFVLTSLSAGAQEFPSRPLRLLVPYPAGAGPDTIARPFANGMSGFLGQPVVVENLSGGGGVPAVLELKKAPPNGYTMFFGESSQWAVYPSLRPDAPFDPIADFAPIGQVYSTDLYIFVAASSPVKDLAELIARARANPGKLKFGVTGVGGIMHLAGEAFKTAARVNAEPIPYRASGESLQGVLRGDLDFAVAGYGSIGALVESGKIRPLVTMSSERNTLYTPAVAAMPELVPEAKAFDFPSEIGLIALAGTARPVIEKLNAAMRAGQKDPGFQKALRAVYYVAKPSSPEQLAERIRTDLAKYRAVAKLANIKAE